jgi:hypothetical protein
MLPPLAESMAHNHRPPATRMTSYTGLALIFVPVVGELVQSTTGQWMVRPPLRCPRGHPLRPGRMLVGSIACSCGRHLTWRCECGAVTYGPGHDTAEVLAFAFGQGCEPSTTQS